MPATLYLFIGYPGAGKTTIAKIISDKTHAVHLWADVERHKLFKEPTHSEKESHELYDKLNKATDYLLEQGKSVVFDTNFNHFADRQKLRQIADKHAAKTVIVWVTTPIKVARQRSVKSHKSRNLYSASMTDEQFKSITVKLEPPLNEEGVIKIDGSKISKPAVIK